MSARRRRRSRALARRNPSALGWVGLGVLGLALIGAAYVGVVFYRLTKL